MCLSYIDQVLSVNFSFILAQSWEPHSTPVAIWNCICLQKCCLAAEQKDSV
ncbi:hypothetical protein Nmel_010539 [Mimus melanotis]